MVLCISNAHERGLPSFNETNGLLKQSLCLEHGTSSKAKCILKTTLTKTKLPV